MELPYGMYDADNHLYETRESFTRHLPANRRRDLFWSTDERGHSHIIMGGHVWDYVPNPTFNPVSVAGALTDMFTGEKSKAQVITDGYKVVEPLAEHPEYQYKEARLARLTEQGIDGCLLFPTLASGIEERVREDIPLMFDILWAFNRWLEEDWGFNIEGRIYSAPIMALADVGPRRGADRLDDRAGLQGRRHPLRPGAHRPGLPLAGRPHVRPGVGPHGRGRDPRGRARRSGELHEVHRRLVG